MIITSILLSVGAGISAALWSLLAVAAIRRSHYLRAAVQIIMALSTGASTFLLLARGAGHPIPIPLWVSTVILGALFLIPAVIAYVDHDRAQKVLAQVVSKPST